MRRALRITARVAAALALSACSKDDERIETDFAPPHPAPLARSAPESLAADYRLGPESRVDFSLPARNGEPEGVVARAEGTLTVDLAELSKTRGTVRFDLGSIRMTGAGDPGEAARRTRAAKNWLDLGSERPAAARRQARWATFTIDGIDEPSVRAAHAASRLEEPDEAAGGERRRARFTVRGALTLHSVRVRKAVEMSATFHYPAPAISGVTPSRIVLETKRPVAVNLGAHDIEPRDERGVVLAESLPLLGEEVGREARASLRLVAERVR